METTDVFFSKFLDEEDVVHTRYVEKVSGHIIRKIQIFIEKDARYNKHHI